MPYADRRAIGTPGCPRSAKSPPPQLALVTQQLGDRLGRFDGETSHAAKIILSSLFRKSYSRRYDSACALDIFRVPICVHNC